MDERRIVTIEEMVDSFSILSQSVVAKINIHNKKSYDNTTVYSSLCIPLDKALKIFGNIEVMYPQLTIDSTDEYPRACVKFGVVIE